MTAGAGLLAAAMFVVTAPAAVGAAPAASPRPGAPASAPRPAMPTGTGTATEYRHGAPIRTTLETAVTISPLRLALNVTPSLPVQGDRVTISLTVSNGGNAAVTGLRAALDLVTGTALVGPLTGPVPPGPVPLAAGGTVTFAWTVSVSAEGEVVARARVTATVTGQGPVAADLSGPVAPPGIARLRARLAPNPISIRAGQWFDLEVTVSNTGAVRAAGVLPTVGPIAGAALVVPAPGAAAPEAVTLEPGQSTVFRFSYSANGSGQVLFGATLTGEADLSPPGMASRSAVALEAGTRAALKSAKATAARAAAAVKTWLNPPRPPAPAETPFIGFETAADLRWVTDGFVTLSPSATRVTEGVRSCEAEFLLPRDLTVSPTGAFRPGMRLTAPARGSSRALAPRDWSGFRALRLDVFARADRPLPVALTLIDRRGWQYSTLRTLAPASATTLTFDLAPARDARVDLAGLVSLELAVDTTGLASRPVLWLDGLRFALPPPVVTTTVMDGPALSRPVAGQPNPPAQAAK